MSESNPSGSSEQSNRNTGEPHLTEEERRQREEWARADEWFEDTGLGTPDFFDHAEEQHEQADQSGDEPHLTEEERLQRIVGGDTSEWLEEFGRLMGFEAPEQGEQPEAEAEGPQPEPPKPFR